MKKPLLLLTALLTAFAPMTGIAQSQAALLPTQITKAAPRAKHDAYARAAADIQTQLNKQGLNAALGRNKEIVSISMPCAAIFAACSDTAMLESGAKVMNCLLPYVSQPKRLQVVVCVHSDDTGSADYQQDITNNRANLICGYLAEAAKLDDVAHLVAVGMGHSQPLGPDDSIERRSRNRRLEVFIVPVF